MKLLLIEAVALKKGNGQDIKSPRVFMYPATVLPILAALTPPEFDIRIINDAFEKIDYDEKVDLVAITFYTPSAFCAYEIADRFREKGVKVVMGGVHASALPEEAPEHADSVVVGEGEEDTLIRKNGAATGAAGEAEDTTESSAAGSDLGTRENPIPLGQEAQVGDWKITVTGATLDASDLATDATYEPLEAGSQVVLIDLAATYIGEESGAIMMDMTYKFVGSGGNTYEWLPVGLDGDITDEGEVFPGASVSGYLSFAVASDQVSGGTLSLEEFSFEGERVFFAVE